MQQTATNPEEELLKITFISGLRDVEAKFRQLGAIKAKPAKSVTKMTENFTSKAIAVASSTPGNKSFEANGEDRYNIKRDFGNQANILWLKKQKKCALGLW